MDEKIDVVGTEKVRKIRKRRNPFLDSPEKPKKVIKIEKEDTPATMVAQQIDVEKVKKKP